MSAQRRHWSDWADAQANLSFRWAHSHFVDFVTRRLNYVLNSSKIYAQLDSHNCIREKNVTFLWKGERSTCDYHSSFGNSWVSIAIYVDNLVLSKTFDGFTKCGHGNHVGNVNKVDQTNVCFSDPKTGSNDRPSGFGGESARKCWLTNRQKDSGWRRPGSYMY